MPQNWNGEHIPSKADISTNVLGFKEVGGVGQLVYHNFRFVDYNLVMDKGEQCAWPVCDKKHKPDLKRNLKMTGLNILISLCNLARSIDDYDEPKHYPELIVNWCKENMHPYQVDALYDEMTDKNFDFNSFDSTLAAREGIFEIRTFMDDLENLYKAALFYLALQSILVGNDEEAFNMYKEGRFIETYSFFEAYKHILTDDSPKDARPISKADLLKEMQQDNERLVTHPGSPSMEFETEPYDDYEHLRNLLLELVPDFKLRLKVDSNTGRIVFSADVNSVFDIAWYTLARMISEDPLPEDAGKEKPRPERIMIRCANCGEFLYRRNNRQKYCNKPECKRAKNANNQNDYRKREREKAAAHKRNNSSAPQGNS